MKKDKKKISANTIIFLMAGILILVICFSMVGIAPMIGHFKLIGHRFWIIVSIHLFSNIFLAMGWFILFTRKISWRYFPKFVAARMAGDSTTFINALGSIAGEPLKALYVRDIVPLKEGLATIFLDRTIHTISNTFIMLTGIVTAVFVLDLPHSDGCYVRAYPAAVAEAWVDGHIHAFAFFGAVPQSIVYDNDRCLVVKILPDGTRKRAALFSGFLSHYLIRDRYGRPGKGNDKGNVEGLVGYARRNFMVPIPRFTTWDVFNTWLEEQCRKRQHDRLRGESETIGERLQRDLAAMRALPASPFDACDQASARVTAQSLVRYKTNDYSVPVAYGHRQVWVRGYVDEVVIGCRGEIIARHPRSWEREDVVFDPIHYLPLIEQKINALDQAAPLQGWELPEEFATLRRLMEARMAKQGRREYVQVLRLLESFDLVDLHGAVKQALQLGAISFDAVKHLLLCRVERRPPRLDLSIYPYLPRATVETTSAKAYMRLLSSDAGEAA